MELLSSFMDLWERENPSVTIASFIPLSICWSKSEMGLRAKSDYLIYHKESSQWSQWNLHTEKGVTGTIVRADGSSCDSFLRLWQKLAYAITDYKAQASTYKEPILDEFKKPDKGSSSYA